MLSLYNSDGHSLKSAITLANMHLSQGGTYSECTICNRFYAGKSLRTHKRNCAAEHP